MYASWPFSGKTNPKFLDSFERTKELVSAIRAVRLEKNIPFKDDLRLQVLSNGHDNSYNTVVAKMCNISSIEEISEKEAMSVSFLVRTVEYAIPLAKSLNVEEEIKKADAEIKYLEGFLVSVEKKLSNEKFVANAKPEVVEIERKKKADAESKLSSMRLTLSQLSKN